MSTLLLRFSAPLQAWGAESKFDCRDTQREPTKSAAIGLVASAMGLPRNHSRIAELGRSLRFGVRIDREGRLLEDLHMAHEEGFWEAVRKGKEPNQKYSHMTYRNYLSDAVFLAGLEGADELLEEIHQVLQKPFFPLFLGRRSCPPEGRLCLGIRRDLSLEEALEREPPLLDKSSLSLSIQAEARPGDHGVWTQRDEPLSFDQQWRKHGFRNVKEWRVQIGPHPDPGIPEPETSHDAYLELEG